MMGWVLAFVTSNLTRFLVTVGIIAALFAGTYLKGRWDASSSCNARWQEKVAAERLEQINDNAEAQKAARERIAELTRRNRQMEDLIDVLEREAEADPRADRPALGADSVRRLNRVR